jgi:hypothetical protein
MHKKGYTKKKQNRKTMKTMKIRNKRKTRNKRRNIFGGTSSELKSLRMPTSLTTPSSLTPEKSTSPDTPRTNYSKAHIRGKPIILLNSATPIEGKEPAILFQVSYSSPQQFKDYVNLSERPIEDCFFQSAFALGLSSSRLAKKNAAQANENRMGVSYSSIQKYVCSKFSVLVKHCCIWLFKLGMLKHNLVPLGNLPRALKKFSGLYTCSKT